MSTITAILEADVDGTLHLPLPVEALKTKARAGLWKKIPGPTWMSADFDEPLEDFREFME